ncbi:unnamed protein product [Rhizophagus irregularis]|nr:unnamed protein product [Rhizophagus irregularis]
MLNHKKYLQDYKWFSFYIRTPNIISDTATPSPSTTPPTTPPPGARSTVDISDSEEDVVLAPATKRDIPDIFSQIKRTKTNHPLSLPHKRVIDSSSTYRSPSDNKRSKF